MRTLGMMLGGVLAAAVPLTNAGAAPAARTEAPHGVPPLALRWTAQSVEDGLTVATLTLRNTGAAPLPLGGWSIYVSTLASVMPSHDGDGVTVTPVAGPLVRLRPVAAGTLAPGATLTMTLRHAGVVILRDKGPVGPYLVYDDAPDHGVPLADYMAEPLAAAAQIPGAPAGTGSVVAPQETFAANARIASVPAAALSPVLPTPQQVRRLDGSVRVERLAVSAPAALRGEATLARTFFTTGTAGTPLRLAIAPVAGQPSDEAYRLEIRPGAGIAITGTTAAGVFNGLQSLRQIVANAPRTGATLTLPALDIVDAPRFAHRGLMIDVARNFQDRTRLFRVIDLMARYKLNRLHLHLTDDEGWRLEIPALPELTTVGGRRGQQYAGGAMLPPSYGSGPDPADVHGSGFYTAADYVAILRYAQARHIAVVPEIEMPGHARAAVLAMAERARRLRAAGRRDADDWLLRDPADRSVYSSAQEYHDDVIDPGLPSSYRFIDTVVSHLVALHRQAGVPLRVLHIGGDELAAGAWTGSPAARRAMAALPGADPDRDMTGATADLWDHFYDRVVAMLARHGVRATGWEELGMRKRRVGDRTEEGVNAHFLTAAPLLQVWNNLPGSRDLAVRLANGGYEVVLSPASSLYFDMAYLRDRAEPGHDWAACTGLEDVYRFDPMAPADTALTAAGRAHVVGLEGTLFAETVRAPWRMDYMLLPRLFGLAERAWAPAPGWTGASGAARDAAYAAGWSAFATQVGRQVLPQLDREVAGLSYRIPPPGLMLRDGLVLANGGLPGFTLRYTTDGSVPDRHSAIVNGPIAARGTITVAIFSSTGRAGRPAQIVNP